MNQTKPKTLDQILKQFDDNFTFNGKHQDMNLGMSWQLHGAVRQFIRSEITTLLESLKGEDKDTTNQMNDLAGNPAEWNITKTGWNQRNQELEEDINKILGK